MLRQAACPPTHSDDIQITPLKCVSTAAGGRSEPDQGIAGCQSQHQTSSLECLSHLRLHPFTASPSVDYGSPPDDRSVVRLPKRRQTHQQDLILAMVMHTHPVADAVQKGAHVVSRGSLHAVRPRGSCQFIQLLLYWPKGFSISARGVSQIPVPSTRLVNLPADPSVGLISTTLGPLRTTKPSVLGGMALSDCLSGRPQRT